MVFREGVPSLCQYRTLGSLNRVPGSNRLQSPARGAVADWQGGEGEGGAAGGGYIPPYTFSQNSVLRWFCGYLAKKRTGHPLMWKAVGIRFKEGRDVGMAISGV